MGLFCGSPSDGPCTADDPSECTWHAGRRAMKCPNCGETMRLDTNEEHSWFECDSCWLAGPRDVLDGLAARLAPAGVLAAAEQLLCSVGIFGLTLVSAYEQKRAKLAKVTP